MKRIFTLAILMIATLTFVNAQKFAGIDKSPLDISLWKADRNAPTQAKVVYSRPMKKDREIWGGLIPYGKVWRTGANESTEITFYKDVNFGGENVKAGTYTLYTMATANDFTFILNSTLNTWGAYGYNEAANVVSVKGSMGTNAEAVEAFSIVWENQDDGSVHLILGWDDKHARVAVK